MIVPLGDNVEFTSMFMHGGLAHILGSFLAGIVLVKLLDQGPRRRPRRASNTRRSEFYG